MFAIAFDLVVADTAANHPRSLTQAYADIRTTLARFGFEWRQGSVYTTDNDDLANLFSAIMALKAMPWFPRSVRDIRSFKVEHWSDFTNVVKGPKKWGSLAAPLHLLLFSLCSARPEGHRRSELRSHQLTGVVSELPRPCPG